MNEYFIWWINSNDECSLILRLVRDGLEIPPYLLNEVLSMSGRPTRGRLWVSPGIEFEGVLPNASPLFASDFFDKRGGIVFHWRDFQTVRALPGFITDARVEIVIDTRNMGPEEK